MVAQLARRRDSALQSRDHAVEAELIQSGHSRTAVLFSINAMTSKVGGAVAIGAGYAVLHAGFHPGGHNAPATLEHFKLAYLGPPVIIEAIVAALIRRYPLTEARQRSNREILRVQRR